MRVEDAGVASFNVPPVTDMTGLRDSSFLYDLRAKIESAHDAVGIVTREIVDDFEAPLSTQIREYTVPNEEYLHNLASQVAETRGTILAAGADQGLRLLAMCPLAEGLDIIDIDPTVTLTSSLLLESAFRTRELLGRTPSPEEMIELYSDPDILISLLAREPSNPNQHRFSQAELITIRGMLEMPNGLEGYLVRQLEVNDSFWMKSQQIDRILDIYGRGDIRIHRGNITGGAAMDSIIASRQHIGLVYLSNIVNRGYLSLEEIDLLRSTMEQMTGIEGAKFIQAVAAVETSPVQRYGDEIMTNQSASEGPSDWHYLVQDFQSFRVYASRTNPPLVSGTVFMRISRKLPGTNVTHVGPGVFLQEAA